MKHKGIDYARVYDGYWSQEPEITASDADVAGLADSIVRSCGRLPMLDVGCGEGGLVRALLRHGVDAYGVDVSRVVVARAGAVLPDRFSVGSMLALPFPCNAFETITATDCLAHLSAEDVPAALKEFARVTRRFVYLEIATTEGGDPQWHRTVAGRDWWETRCLDAGFRKHPLYYRLNPYEQLNRDTALIVVALEKPGSFIDPDAAAARLEGEALLHRDMLHETGRRSDAHCIRYHEAAAWVRPGDTVLDLACGLGYGAHILWHNSAAGRVIGIDSSPDAVAYATRRYGDGERVRFEVGDAQQLEGLADDSVDFVASFETIEHLPEPSAYLAELARVLRPSGRLMLSAPNNWADETGKDPNPHHFHVYSWDRLRAECGAHFLLEQGMIQTAGGAQRLHHAARAWAVVDPGRDLPQDAEWVLLLCMKSPVGEAASPYLETVWQIPDDPRFNVLALGRDYANPWLVKGMVAIGLRNSSPANLATMREQTLAQAPPESVDYGAALCGEVYAQLAAGPVARDRYEALTADIQRYAAIRDPAPHQLRWQVSLLFAGGELATHCGRHADALRFFRDSAERDAGVYSPLLGTKTLDALFRLALFALSRNDRAGALEALHRGIAEAKRLTGGSWLNVVGDPLHPIPAGPAELALLLDKAARAAYLIAAIERGGDRPALIEGEAMGFFERQLSGLQQAGKAARQHASALADRVRELQAQIERQEAHAQSLAAEVRHQHANAEAIAKEAQAQSALAQRFARRTVELEAEISAFRRNPLRLLKRRG